MRETRKQLQHRDGDTSVLLAQLDAQGLDVLAHAEAFLRYAKEINRNVTLLKNADSVTRQTEAMHLIRTFGSQLLGECQAFCDTVSELQKLAEREAPEQRVESNGVADERRRHR